MRQTCSHGGEQGLDSQGYAVTFLLKAHGLPWGEGLGEPPGDSREA